MGARKEGGEGLMPYSSPSPPPRREALKEARMEFHVHASMG